MTLKRRPVIKPPMMTKLNPGAKTEMPESISIDWGAEGRLLRGKAKDTISADELGEVGEVALADAAVAVGKNPRMIKATMIMTKDRFKDLASDLAVAELIPLVGDIGRPCEFHV
jgi:hypothetical protein